MRLSKHRNILSAAAVGGVVALTLLCGGKPAQAIITFNFTQGTALQNTAQPQRDLVVAGFQRAANRWSSLFSNTYTFNLTIDYQSLSTGVIGQAGSNQTTSTYANYRNALTTGATSVDDLAAVASLAPTSLPVYINRTTDNPNGSGSSTPYLDNNGDANNTTIRMNTANAKALGLLSATNGAVDAAITFSSNFAFDFNPDDGIASNQVDFVGVATHEIGHALGFVSGVDYLDTQSIMSSTALTQITPLDTFRYSSQSAAAITGGAIDFTADTRDKYFSLDRGATSIARFSTGRVNGDRQQASHWKDNLGIGIMDPTAAFGELLSISNNDLRAFDVIGYRLAAMDTPEPSTFGLMGFAGLGVVGVRRLRSRRRNRAK